MLDRRRRGARPGPEDDGDGRASTRSTPRDSGADDVVTGRRSTRDGRAEDQLPDGDPASIVRRAPFADSPFVGERGQRAQNRILEAALQVLGEVGYHGCGIKAITEVSGYSRASFYQYFSSKEDLFRHLAGKVARELNASADALCPITPDQAGWDELHAWLRRYSAIYDAYEPVFVTFQTAVVTDSMVASGASVVASRSFNDLRSRIKGSILPPAHRDELVRTLGETVSRLNRECEVLQWAAAKDALNRDRINVAFADTCHRALFGPLPDVNIHTSTKRLKPLVAVTDIDWDTDVQGDPSHGPVAQRTRTTLLEAGHRVFVERGFYATRVADIVKAAGVSHGVFYRYFDNKTALFKILAERASERLSVALDGIPTSIVAPRPDAAAEAELRAWLRLYSETYVEESSIFTMWSEAISRDGELGTISAAVIEGSRARLARYLAPRGWGDADADALVFVVFLDAMTAHRQTPARLENFARMIERGLFDGAAPSARPTTSSAAPKRAKKAPTKTQRKATTKR